MSSNFWSEFSFPSPVDDILKRPSFTLEDLLDEDDVVVDTRSQKEDLKEFLIKKETLKALIQYISKDAPADSSDTVKFRYPAVACEILTAEVVEIDRELVTDSELLHSLFYFFDKENVNPLLANLVLRVISSLMTTRLGTLLDYLKLHPEFFGNLLNHLNCAAVPDFISRLVGVEAEYEGKGTLQWLVDNKFVEQLIYRFSPEYVNLQSDLARTVVEIVVSSSESSPLVQRFYVQENVELLLSLVLKEGNEHGFRSGLAVVSQLLRGLSLSSSSIPPDGRDIDLIQTERPPPDTPLAMLPPVIRQVMATLPKLNRLLESPPVVKHITNQLGMVVVVGFGVITNNKKKINQGEKEKKKKNPRGWDWIFTRISF
eukprot:TRINITY_DN7821_c0_g1_i2.p1 TRINITY_DN7821_c0_g1~~TRINITY_DN7821_c0_g1_i2.p1  ORF type:complete len:372 (+),score=68.66 TRINITY_DN7821_c0_g1_i2:168-1283(+)